MLCGKEIVQEVQRKFAEKANPIVYYQVDQSIPGYLKETVNAETKKIHKNTHAVKKMASTLDGNQNLAEETKQVKKEKV